MGVRRDASSCSSGAELLEPVLMREGEEAGKVWERKGKGIRDSGMIEVAWGSGLWGWGTAPY